jgi:hypothetical protein
MRPRAGGSGTIVVDPENHFLYHVQAGGRATRYGVGVGGEGFGWSGTATVHEKHEWPDWYPTKEILQRKPEIRAHLVDLPGGLGMPGGRTIRSGLARCISGRERRTPSIAFTAPTSRKRSGKACRPAAFAWSTRKWWISTRRHPSAQRSWSCRPGSARHLCACAGTIARFAHRGGSGGSWTVNVPTAVA